MRNHWIFFYLVKGPGSLEGEVQPGVPRGPQLTELEKCDFSWTENPRGL